MAKRSNKFPEKNKKKNSKKFVKEKSHNWGIEEDNLHGEKKLSRIISIKNVYSEDNQNTKKLPKNFSFEKMRKPIYVLSRKIYKKKYDWKKGQWILRDVYIFK